jgi:microcystin-dependent protein
MSAVAQISISYAPFSSFNTIPLENDRPVTPRVLAQYFLYNRNLAPSYGLTNNDYLTYDGGFITQDSKLDIKYSDFEIRTEEGQPNRGGNLTVNGERTARAGVFRNNISIISQNNTITNRITNVKRLDSLDDFIGSQYDSDAMTVGDYKRFAHFPGMIMMWSGSFQDLESQMPYWRLCAPPHSGQTINGITVPNLLSKFVPGSIPADRPRSSNNTLYTTGDTGGTDGASLTMSQMPGHHHNVVFSFNDPMPRFTRNGQSQLLTYRPRYGVAGGGIAMTITANNVGVCDDKGITCTCEGSDRSERYCARKVLCADVKKGFSCCRYSYRYWCTLSSSVTQVPAGNVTVITSATVKDYVQKTFSFTNTSASITTQGQSNRGNNDIHENRPSFYTLAYIIYVGEGE